MTVVYNQSRCLKLAATALLICGCTRPANTPAPQDVVARAGAERSVSDHLRGQTMPQRIMAAQQGDDESLKILCLIARETWLPDDLRQPAEEAISGGTLAILPRIFAQQYPGPNDVQIARLIQECVRRRLTPGSESRLENIVAIRRRLLDAAARIYPRESSKGLATLSASARTRSRPSRPVWARRLTPNWEQPSAVH